MAKVSKSDELLFKFLQKDFGDPFMGEPIDPDQMDYSCPDFGFDNYMIFDDKSKVGLFSSLWKYLMDYAAPFPRYERLKNYIEFVNEQKLQNLLNENTRKNSKYPHR